MMNTRSWPDTKLTMDQLVNYVLPDGSTRLVAIELHPVHGASQLANKYYYLILARLGIPVLIVTDTNSHCEWVSRMYGENTFYTMTYTQFNQEMALDGCQSWFAANVPNWSDQSSQPTAVIQALLTYMHGLPRF